MIRTKPGFSVPALLSLALGIGANVAIFSVVNGAVIIRPLRFILEPGKLMGVFNSAQCFQARPSRSGPSHSTCTRRLPGTCAEF